MAHETIFSHEEQMQGPPDAPSPTRGIKEAFEA